MFAYLRGEVIDLDLDRVVLDVSGVGYELFASSRTLGVLQKGEEANLHVHMHFSQDMVVLYGFISIEEKKIFRRLINVSRVGPKVALSALSAVEVSALAAAIVTGDEAVLSRIPGMGKKTAQRVILELKEKIAKEEAIQPSIAAFSNGSIGDSIQQEAISALIALGYDVNTATYTVSRIPQPADTVEQLITMSLRSLASK